MRLGLLISIQALLMAPGLGLKCRTCYESDKLQNQCNVNSDVCGHNQVCLTLHIRTLTIDSQITSFYIRRHCWNYRGCGHSGRLSSPSYKMIFSSSCCSDDDCMPPIPALPPENTTLNGLVCPASSSFHGGDPEPRSAMRCSGDEAYCLEFVSGFVTDKKKLSGCASNGYCQLQSAIGEFYSLNPNLGVPWSYCKKANQTSHLPVVNSLLCKQCQGSITFGCDAYVRCAPEHDACVTIVLNTSYGGRNTLQLTRRCGFSSECETAGSITSAQKSISRSTSCCYTDDCVSPIPEVFSESADANGRTCESCYVRERNRCTSRDHIQCTGTATMCMTFNEKVTEGTSSSTEILRGCAHPGLCNIRNMTVTYDYRTVQETKTCSIPATSVVPGPDSPCVLVMVTLLHTYSLFS